MTNIPDKAVEAFRNKAREWGHHSLTNDFVNACLQAAAPFMQQPKFNNVQDLLKYLNEPTFADGIEAAAQLVDPHLDDTGRPLRDLAAKIRALKPPEQT